MKPTAFERLVGALDHPMVVVTAATRRSIGGCLVGFSTQCSLDPPRYCVFLSKANHTYEVARKAGYLMVHFLDHRQHDLAAWFGEHSALGGHRDAEAGPHTGDADTGDEAPVDKFAAVRWRAGPDGRTPRLTEVDAWLFGRVVDRHDVGDHVAFVLDPVRTRVPRRLRPIGFQQVRDLHAAR